MNRMVITLDGLDSHFQVHLTGYRPITRQQYRKFVAANPELRSELSADGQVKLMPPVYARGGNQNSNLTMQLGIWAERDGQGVGFDSSAGFDLPNGSNRSPDASWVRRSRLDILSQEEKDEYLPLCPDFVVELRSRSETLETLKAKMHEYMENGAQLGWLIDPIKETVFVYRPRKPVERLERPASISADPELPGFILDLSGIWHPDF